MTREKDLKDRDSRIQAIKDATDEFTEKALRKIDFPLLRLKDLRDCLQEKLKAKTKGFNYKYCDYPTTIEGYKTYANPLGLLPVVRPSHEKLDNGRVYIKINVCILDLFNKDQAIADKCVASSEGLGFYVPTIKDCLDFYKDGKLPKNAVVQYTTACATQLARKSLDALIGIHPEEDKDGNF